MEFSILLMAIIIIGIIEFTTIMLVPINKAKVYAESWNYDDKTIRCIERTKKVVLVNNSITAFIVIAVGILPYFITVDWVNYIIIGVEGLIALIFVLGHILILILPNRREVISGMGTELAAAIYDAQEMKED